MNTTRHLSSDEIVERVFPADDRPAAVPEHLANCVECQERIANLREAWLLDRGAVSGAVDDLPSEFWQAQAAAAMTAVRIQAAAPEEGAEIRRFPARARGILRHPALALSSIAAALLLVGGLSLLRPPGDREAARTAAAVRTPAVTSDAADDALLVSIDRTLEDSSLAGLVVEESL